MGNSCFGYRKNINELKIEYELEINYMKSIHYDEINKCNKMIEKQQKEIDLLHNKVFNLNQKCEQLMLDYYNLENAYAKCKNDLGKYNNFRNIFSL